jgi:pimeloyl-ACP methyl ester carboxylesterase
MTSTPVLPARSQLLTESDAAAAFRRGPDRHLDVGHSRLAYWRFGRGPDVVFIHGWPLHAATFRRLVPLLAEDFTLHLFDLPGTGKTEWDDDAPIDLASHATTARRAIEALHLSSYALLAHDSGGAIARMVAAGDERVSGIVMGNTDIPGHRPWLIRLLVLLQSSALTRGSLLKLMRSRLVRHSPLGFRGCFTDPTYVDGEFTELFLAPLFSSKRAAYGQLALLRTLDFGVLDRLVEAHAQIRAPVLCIWGPDDPFFPLAKARRMLSQFKSEATLVEIPGAKLFAHEDHPDAFAAFAKPFLQRCTRGVGRPADAGAHEPRPGAYPASVTGT